MQNPLPEEIRVEVRSTVDIVTVRQHGREMALQLGFPFGEVTSIAAAISEIARNILDHAKQGEVLLSIVQRADRQGLQIIAQDQGPGIPDINQALQYGYSTRRGLGVGLPGAKWLMDEFEIETKVGQGTKITMHKWLPHDAAKLNKLD